MKKPYEKPVLKEKHVPIGSKMPGYYYFREQDKYLCTTPRVASSSMHKAVHGKPTVAVDQLLMDRGAGIHIWFRDPLDRLASTYRIMHEGKTFGEFIEHIGDYWNRHWVQQTEIHTVDGVFLPTRVHNFINLEACWKEEFPGYPLPHLKNFDRMPYGTLLLDLTKNQIDIAHEYYKDDIDLYRKLSVYD